MTILKLRALLEKEKESGDCMNIEMRPGEHLDIDVNMTKEQDSRFCWFDLRAVVDERGQPKKKGKTFRVRVFPDKLEIALVMGLGVCQEFEISDIADGKEVYGKTISIIEKPIESDSDEQVEQKK